MLPIIKNKILLFVNTVTSLSVCALTICVGGLEIYADIREHALNNDRVPYSTPKIIALSIFCFANVSVFGHIVYMSTYALKGSRYTWYMSCNYFMYVVSEIVSAVVVFTTFSDLFYPIGLSLLVGIQSVLLFFITCSTESIFAQVELDSEIEEDVRLYRKALSRYRRQHRLKRHCVTVSLHPEDIDTGAGPSGIQDTFSIASSVSRK